MTSILTRSAIFKYKIHGVFQARLSRPLLLYHPMAIYLIFTDAPGWQAKPNPVPLTAVTQQLIEVPDAHSGVRRTFVFMPLPGNAMGKFALSPTPGVGSDVTLPHCMIRPDR
ncbi:MAG: hypothetical protein M0Z58_03180, partial [Nitrospiraceae bacterium]|nr:hypothetical protein [Nitrospiraceae bacterium]